MKQITFKHIRNATAKIVFNGVTLLVDPLLAPKGEYPGFEVADTVERKLMRNPLIELPEPAEEILKNIEAVVLTHTHLDHWDPIAEKIIPKYITIFVQHAGDKKLVQSKGFTDVRVVGINTPFKGITITKTGGQHGSDQMLSNPAIAEISDESMGFILRAPEQKVVYFAGDTIWHEYFEIAVKKYEPDYIILNTGEAKIEGFEGSLIMGTNDVKKCYEFSKKAKIITVHMDAINHCVCSREMMRKFVTENKLDDRVLIPNDGEIFNLN
jgi:L-ascorbate metabolism protein UlaG (beta-lactamase superfamily)